MWCLAALTLALSLFSAQGQTDTYGTEFRMVFLDNYVDCPVDRAVDLYMCNKAGGGSAVVNISIPHFNNRNCPQFSAATITAEDCLLVTLCEEIRHTYADGSISNKVVDITSSIPISVQGFNVEKFSADSYLVMPWDLAGQIYYILTYSPQHVQTQFAITTKEMTRVRIVIPDRAGETLTVDYNGIRYSNGQTVQFTLEPANTFLAQSAGDLSGVLIQTDKPVAVFTGNVRTWNNYEKRSRDHLVEQVPSTTKWGSEFIYVPTPRATPGDTVKIIARSANTNIDIITDTVQTYNIPSGGQFIELELTEMSHIRATGNILVAVIVHSQDGKSVGTTDPADPSLYFLPAVTQFDDDFYMPAFSSADSVPYQKTFVIIALPEGSESQLRIDDGGFGSNPLFLTKPTSGSAMNYVAGVYEVFNNSPHRINMANGENMMVIGYGASDRESFASSLGYEFNLACTDTTMQPLDGIDNDCDGLVDEETCGNEVDDDGDGLMDEDCTGSPTTTQNPYDDTSTSSGTADATGNEFAIVYMSNIVKDATVVINQIELYVSALEDGTTISVTAPAYTDANGPNLNNVNASLNSVLQIEINPVMRISNEGSELGASRISNKGIRVMSNKNIVLYGINKKQFSTDGFLALPTNVIGDNYFSYCNFPINLNDDRCQLAAVAIEDGTEIFFDLAAGVATEPLDGQTFTGPGTFSVTLNAYQVLELQSRNDLTGTRVYTNDGKRFSFFAGNVRTRIPLSRGSRDHLVEQLPPAETWGSDFSVINTPRTRDLGDIFKVIARADATEVTYTYINQQGVETTDMFTLTGSGSSRDIALGFASPMSIRTSKPSLVIQMSQSATNRDTDPASIVVIPETQWSNNYRFVTPLSGQVNENGMQMPFDNVVLIAIHKDFRPGMRFTDQTGVTIDLGADPNWVAIPGSDNEGILYDVPTGQSAIFHDDENAKFMALIFGRADRETYGNAIGLRLSRNQCTPTVGQTTGDGIDNDCDGFVDEEACNGVDDDLDNLFDEDCGIPPSGFKYCLVFEENVVEYPRNYALEIYVGNPNSGQAFCRLETPNTQNPSYDVTTAIGATAVQKFAVSAALRTLGTRISPNVITVTCDQAVTVMGVNKETFSNDAFIAFEERQLGTTYYTMSFGPATIQTQFAVLACTGPGTTDISMTFAAPVVYQEVTRGNLDLTLRHNDIFQAQSDGDLTGSYIVSTRPIAVYSGNIRTKVALSASRDHLASQIPPVASYGTEFNLVPTAFRTVGDLFRVVASQANTQVTYRDETPIVLANPGDFTELDVASNSNGQLTADKPVMVMQIMKSQQAPKIEEAADPCFILVPPVDQYEERTTLVTPLYTEGYYQTGADYTNRMTLIVPNGAESGMRINGNEIASATGVNQLSSQAIAFSGYTAINLELVTGGTNSYTLTHTSTNTRFSGYLVGIADRESYCVSIGPKLPELP